MSGGTKSLKERLAEVESSLAEYEHSIGWVMEKERKCAYLNLTYEQIKSMTIEQAAEIACDLAIFATGLQKNLNQHIARVNWCDGNLRIVYGQECHKYPAYSYAEKQDAVIVNNEYATKLFQLKMKAQLVIDRLNYIPSKIDFIIKQLNQLQYSKGNYNREKYT